MSPSFLFGKVKILSATFVLLMSINSNANLPLAVDGEKLPSLAPMIETVSPAVVNIFTTSTIKMQDNPLLNDPFFRRFFEEFGGQTPGGGERQSQSLGTGVIINADKGYIVTNNHVVDGADEISVQLEDGRKFEGKLIGSDNKADVAVIQIEAEKLNQVPLGNSEALRVGDFVVAVGNPFGLGHTVTSGIVSALGRSGLNIEEYENFIQTDASINPGNSGGALVNLRGELVGINTAIIGRSGNVGIGFAIPVNMVSTIVEQLVEFGEVKRGQLGVYIQDLDQDLAQALNIKDLYQGAVITDIVKNSSADEAGLKAGDVIIKLDGRDIKNTGDLRNRVGLTRIDEKVEIEYLRDGKLNKIDMKIKANPDQDDDGASINNQNSQAPSDKLKGAVLKNVKDGLEQGVLVESVEPSSPADKAGLIAGDIIFAVNRLEVKNIDEIRDVLKSTNPDVILLNIKRNGGALFLVVR